MNVILLTDVADLGGKGDIVEVSSGYARNYLLPKRFAMKATEGAIKQADKLRQQRIEAPCRPCGEYVHPCIEYPCPYRARADGGGGYLPQPAPPRLCHCP